MQISVYVEYHKCRFAHYSAANLYGLSPGFDKYKEEGENTMPQQVYFISGLLAAIALLAYAFSKSIKKHDAKMKAMKKKKGRKKYIQEYKKPGK